MVHPDLLSAVFTVTLANGDDEVFDSLIKLYDEAQVCKVNVDVNEIRCFILNLFFRCSIPF